MRVLLVLALVLCASSAMAQTLVPVLVKITAGTGFFITHDGALITNAHVVKNCRTISVKLEDGEHAAVLAAIDPGKDLALLRVTGGAPGIASLRWNIRDLKPGDEVAVMGYPGQEGVNGHSMFKKTTVLGLNGPTGEPQWLQLDSVAEHGNSGGPVLDAAGNVIGVVTGNAMTYRTYTDNATGKQAAPPELVGKSDIAITLPVLEAFLNDNSVYYNESSSGLVLHPDDDLERTAHSFIFPVRCYL